MSRDGDVAAFLLREATVFSEDGLLNRCRP